MSEAMPMDQSMGHSMAQHMGQPMGQSMGQNMGHPMDQTMTQTMVQPMPQPMPVQPEPEIPSMPETNNSTPPVPTTSTDSTTESSTNNPWAVTSIYDFNYFCCPECDHKTQDKQQFVVHAAFFHARVSLKPLKFVLQRIYFL